MMETLIVIRTQSQLEELALYLSDKDLISFDTETTGLARESQVVGFSICADPTIGYYVVISAWNKDSQTLIEVFDRQTISDFISKNLTDKRLIAHNAVFDASMIEVNFGVSLMPYVHTDTMVLAHLLDENRSNALKELGTIFFGEDATKEQNEMKESVKANGGSLTKDNYELYKADSELLARYGAKDTILTLKLFYVLVPQLYDEGLDKFFYEEESMPLLRGPTYDMNTTGLKVDTEKLQNLKGELEAECLELITFINREIAEHVKDKYPGINKKNTFNIGSGQQLAWLLFVKLGQPFHRLTDTGKEVCKALGLRVPYSFKAKRDFMQVIAESEGYIYQPECKDLKTGKTKRAKKVGDISKYLSTDAEALELYANKYVWVKKLLEYSKAQKILSTYVEGIQERVRYGIIRPEFKQIGTTSGRYSSKNPNFQNLPRNDKRVKGCIVARKGNVFVGADYSQLEPRIFASLSNDPRLLQCFKDGDDFYSVVGTGTFGREGYSLKKEDEGSFAQMFPDERQISKEDVSLASVYGTTANKMAPAIGKSVEEAQEILDNYFEAFPGVKNFMLERHETVKAEGRVYSIYGRPRRIPLATKIPEIYGTTKHSELPYEARTLLNLAVNHTIQSSGASIMNRAAIRTRKVLDSKGYFQVKIVMQVHDELILEGPKALKDEMAAILKDSMENTTILPNVSLIAKPVVANNLADLK